MFNFGWGELVVIGIVALIAIGPKELPTVLRTLGQWMGKVRRMANEFQGQFQEALREAEFADLKKHADDISSSVSELSTIDPLADVQKDVERSFEEKPAATPSADPAAPDGAMLPAGVVPPATDVAPPPLPQIDVPLPEPPATVTDKDFAPAEPPPVQETVKETVKKAGSA
ncbi:MAG TPA: Sec-independent protein translocase protein TatB [Pseudolabrys sp.]|jgi:sec-independent protein translocase protein TatB